MTPADIKCPQLLALIRKRSGKRFSMKKEIHTLFIWILTPEGDDFWFLVQQGMVKEITINPSGHIEGMWKFKIPIPEDQQYNQFLNNLRKKAGYGEKDV